MLQQTSTWGNFLNPYYTGRRRMPDTFQVEAYQEETFKDDHADNKGQTGTKKRSTKSRKAGKPE